MAKRHTNTNNSNVVDIADVMELYTEQRAHQRAAEWEGRRDATIAALKKLIGDIAESDPVVSDVSALLNPGLLAKQLETARATGNARVITRAIDEIQGAFVRLHGACGDALARHGRSVHGVCREAAGELSQHTRWLPMEGRKSPLPVMRTTSGDLILVPIPDMLLSQETKDEMAKGTRRRPTYAYGTVGDKVGIVWRFAGEADGPYDAKSAYGPDYVRLIAEPEGGICAVDFRKQMDNPEALFRVAVSAVLKFYNGGGPRARYAAIETARGMYRNLRAWTSAVAAEPHEEVMPAQAPAATQASAAVSTGVQTTASRDVVAAKMAAGMPAAVAMATTDPGLVETPQDPPAALAALEPQKPQASYEEAEKWAEANLHLIPWEMGRRVESPVGTIHVVNMKAPNGDIYRCADRQIPGEDILIGFQAADGVAYRTMADAQAAEERAEAEAKAEADN